MCCGKNREAARAAALSAGIAGASRARVAPAAPAHDLTSLIVFEFTGGAPATIRGPASGRMYRFESAGDRAQVDARDRRALLSHPALRWIR
jgi:hypothetical protein